jgi:hypothetical protein
MFSVRFTNSICHFGPVRSAKLWVAGSQGPFLGFLCAIPDKLPKIE